MKLILKVTLVFILSGVSYLTGRFTGGKDALLIMVSDIEKAFPREEAEHIMTTLTKATKANTKHNDCPYSKRD